MHALPSHVANLSFCLFSCYFVRYYRTMVHFMWQVALYGVQSFLQIVCAYTDPGGVRHLISPWWLEEM